MFFLVSFCLQLRLWAFQFPPHWTCVTSRLVFFCYISFYLINILLLWHLHNFVMSDNFVCVVHTDPVFVYVRYHHPCTPHDLCPLVWYLIYLQENKYRDDKETKLQQNINLIHVNVTLWVIKSWFYVTEFSTSKNKIKLIRLSLGTVLTKLRYLLVEEYSQLYFRAECGWNTYLFAISLEWILCK